MSKNIRNDISGDSIFWSRHEMKYLISESQASAIAQFIRPYMRLDYYCELQPTGAYPIASLYFDSDNLVLCNESLLGCKNRFKLRIRSYTDELDYPCYFEIKRRENVVIIKSRAAVLPESVEPLISGSRHRVNTGGKAGDSEVINQFLLYFNNINARPVVRTRYIRQAFLGVADKRVRVTFDRNLCYNATYSLDVGLDNKDWHNILSNSVILEVKFTGSYPAWLGRMAKYFGLRQRSVSKYVHSVKQACLAGRCHYREFARR